MQGAYSRGNVTPATELNIFVDPEAARAEFDVPWRLKRIRDALRRICARMLLRSMTEPPRVDDELAVATTARPGAPRDREPASW